MQRHVPGHADAIAQVAQGCRAPRRWWQGHGVDQGRESCAERDIEVFRSQGAAAKNCRSVLDHPAEGKGCSIGRFGLAGFRVGTAQGPGAPIDLGGQCLLVGISAGIAATHLGRQIVGVGVEVALGAEVAGALLQPLKPAANGRMLAAQQKALVVGQACCHALHVGHEHQISGA